MEHQALRIDFRDEKGGTFRQPLEDLSYLILDTLEVSISAAVLTGCADRSVLIVGTNSKHLPNWTALPCGRYHRGGDTLNLQVSASLPQKKRIWSRLVSAKITGQAQHLQDLGREEEAYALLKIASLVKSGDKKNLEARAARRYWAELFAGNNFRRHDDDLANALLNYGYALIRAALARILCSLGFVPQLGIHHNSVSNAYNLADDLIEPLRPIVDRVAYRIFLTIPANTDFSPDHRRGMARLFEQNLLIDGQVYSMMHGLQAMCSGLRKALELSDPNELPIPILAPR